MSELLGRTTMLPAVVTSFSVLLDKLEASSLDGASCESLGIIIPRIEAIATSNGISIGMIQPVLGESFDGLSSEYQHGGVNSTKPRSAL